jgi:hypothetical protein
VQQLKTECRSKDIEHAAHPTVDVEKHSLMTILSITYSVSLHFELIHFSGGRYRRLHNEGIKIADNMHQQSYSQLKELSNRRKITLI